MSKRCWRPHLSLSSGDQFSEGRGLVSHTVAQRWPAAAPQTHKTRPDQAGAGTGVAAAAPGGSLGCWQWLPNGSGVALVLRTWWALGSAGPPAGLKPSGQMPEPSRLPQGPRTSEPGPAPVRRLCPPCPKASQASQWVSSWGWRAQRWGCLRPTQVLRWRPATLASPGLCCPLVLEPCSCCPASAPPPSPTGSSLRSSVPSRQQGRKGHLDTHLPWPVVPTLHLFLNGFLSSTPPRYRPVHWQGWLLRWSTELQAGGGRNKRPSLPHAVLGHTRHPGWLPSSSSYS